MIRRAHTAANVAPCLRTLLAQINAAYPSRSKGADGIWPSPAHTAQNPDSDHEAGNALDIDDDLSGVDGRPPQVTPALAALISGDHRCKYSIHDGTIYKHGVGSRYDGANPHTGHVHISVYEAFRGNQAPWNIGQEDDVAIDCLFVIVHGSAANLQTVAKIAAGMGLWSAEVTPFDRWVHVRKGPKSDLLIAKLESFAAFEGKVTTVPTYSGSFRDIEP